jgi:hypothetical protein
VHTTAAERFVPIIIQLYFTSTVAFTMGKEKRNEKRKEEKKKETTMV